MGERTPGETQVSHRRFVSYIDKSREYYAAKGHEHPYLWARHADVPFEPLTDPLSNSRVGLVTTSNPMRSAGAVSDRAPDGAKEPYAAPAWPAPDAMYTADLAWDKAATHTDDVGSFLPLAHLALAAEQGRIGSTSPRFYGVPTEYSQRRTCEIDAPQIVDWCLEDKVCAVILIPL